MNVRETMIFIRKPIGEIASSLQSLATPSELVEGSEIALLYEGLGPGGSTFGLSTDMDAPEGDRWTHLLSSDDSPEIIAALLRQMNVGREQLRAATDWQGTPLIDLSPIEARLEQVHQSGLMTRKELVASVGRQASLSRSDAQAAVDAVFDVIAGELKRGREVRITGFGNFSMAAGTDEVAAARAKSSSKPRFTPGKSLKNTG